MSASRYPGLLTANYLKHTFSALTSNGAGMVSVLLSATPPAIRADATLAPAGLPAAPVQVTATLPAAAGRAVGQYPLAAGLYALRLAAT